MSNEREVEEAWNGICDTFRNDPMVFWVAMPFMVVLVPYWLGCRLGVWTWEQMWGGPR